MLNKRSVKLLALLFHILSSHRGAIVKMKGAAEMQDSHADRWWRIKVAEQQIRTRDGEHEDNRNTVGLVLLIHLDWCSTTLLRFKVKCVFVCVWGCSRHTYGHTDIQTKKCI